MIVLYVLGYFNRNKQNSYAALNISLSMTRLKVLMRHYVQIILLEQTPDSRSNKEMIYNIKKTLLTLR